MLPFLPDLTLDSRRLNGAKFCIHLRSSNFSHFRMDETTGLKMMALKHKWSKVNAEFYVNQSYLWTASLSFLAHF
jgi:hypothetical protein